MKASQDSPEKTSRPYFLSSLHATQALTARAIHPQEVALIDWSERKELHRFRTDQGPLRALALHPDGKQVAALGDKAEVKIWDSHTGAALLKVDRGGQNLAFSGDGGLLFVGNGAELVALDSTTGEVRWSREDKDFHHPTLLTLSPDGKMLAWSAFGGHRVHLLDPGTGETILSLGGQDEVFAMAFYSDNKRLAISINTNRPAPYHVQVWRLKKDESMVPDRELAIINLSVALAISPGGGTVATGDGQGAQLWDYASGSPERRLAERQLTKVAGLGTVEHPRPSLAATLRFDQEGQHLVSDGEYLRLWDAKSGDLLWTYTP